MTSKGFCAGSLHVSSNESRAKVVSTREPFHGHSYAGAEGGALELSCLRKEMQGLLRGLWRKKLESTRKMIQGNLFSVRPLATTCQSLSIEFLNFFSKRRESGGFP
jgi:hypothetical protein